MHDLTLTIAYIGADLVAIAILVGALYIPRHGRRDLVAAYIGVNVGVLAVTLLLSSSSNVGAGLGLGLFGVLSIIRLRSSSLAQGEVAYFFAALALGLLGGIQSHLLIVIILMVLIIAALWIGDHPGLMRDNRNQTVTLDRAVTDENDLILELEDLLGAQVRSIELKSLDLVNDMTIVDVHYRIRRRPRSAKPVPQQQTASEGPRAVHEVPPLAPQSSQSVQPQQQAWPDAASQDSAASAAAAAPQQGWTNQPQQQAAQPNTAPPPIYPPYN